jgi:hypothetical protein
MDLGRGANLNGAAAYGATPWGRKTAPAARDVLRLRQGPFDGTSDKIDPSPAPRGPAITTRARRPLQAPVDRFPGQDMFDVVKNSPGLAQGPQLRRPHRMELAVCDGDDHRIVAARD